MPKIGIVLAGAASKGAYEIGCIKAIGDYFGIDSIKAVTSASSGSIVAQAYGLGMLDQLEDVWRNIDPKKEGRFFLSFAGNERILSRLDIIAEANNTNFPFQHYSSIWNFTQKKVEYIPFHEISGEPLKKYLRGAIAIPFVTKGSKLEGDLLLDGAFLDNIPVYPLVGKDLDYIFCIYFDNCKYNFETEDFNRKIISVSDFPNSQMLELMSYQPEAFDKMVKYGYEYTTDVIKSLFEQDTDVDIYDRIKKRALNSENVYKPRLTADTVLNNINVMTKRYSKRLSNREKIDEKTEEK